MSTRASMQRSEAAWSAARSFEELCELGARFVEGELDFFPGWNAPDLDGESDEIAPVLAELCRAGFLTVASQPARAEQRAFVAGFATPRLAQALLHADPAHASSAQDIVVVAYGPGVDAHPAHEREPVSLHGGVAHAFAGHDARAEEIVCFEDHVTPAALEDLRAQAWVTAYDRQWGRAGALWEHLQRVLADAQR